MFSITLNLHPEYEDFLSRIALEGWHQHFRFSPRTLIYHFCGFFRSSTFFGEGGEREAENNGYHPLRLERSAIDHYSRRPTISVEYRTNGSWDRRQKKHRGPKWRTTGDGKIEKCKKKVRKQSKYWKTRRGQIKTAHRRTIKTDFEEKRASMLPNCAAYPVIEARDGCEINSRDVRVEKVEINGRDETKRE